MTIALTGHVKIKKALQLSTYPNITTDKEAFEIVEKLIINTINKNFPNNENLVFVSGMAKGADEIFALIAMKMKKNLFAAFQTAYLGTDQKEPRNTMKF